MLCARSPSSSSRSRSNSSSNGSKMPIQSVDDLTVKITDFGLSAVLPGWVSGSDKPSKQFRGLKEMWGTTEYFAPEVYERAYGFQADVWSLGCILYEMLTGEMAFPCRDRSLGLVERALFHGVYKPKRLFEQRSGWRKLSRGARSLIKGMLKRNPVKRLDIEECLSHPWLKLAEGKVDGEMNKKKVVVHKENSRRIMKTVISSEALSMEVRASYVKRSEYLARRNEKREGALLG
eukprot:scaffold3351_cov160-Ochromonas_danica.AAC.1